MSLPSVDGWDVMLAFVMVAMAVGVGVLLAAMDSPEVQESRSMERYSALLIAVGLAATAARVAQEVLG